MLFSTRLYFEFLDLVFGHNSFLYYGTQMYMNMYFFGMKYMCYMQCVGWGVTEWYQSLSLRDLGILTAWYLDLNYFYCMLRVPDVISTIGNKYNKLKEQCVRWILITSGQCNYKFTGTYLNLNTLLYLEMWIREY